MKWFHPVSRSLAVSLSFFLFLAPVWTGGSQPALLQEAPPPACLSTPDPPYSLNRSELVQKVIQNGTAYEFYTNRAYTSSAMIFNDPGREVCFDL